jgi:uncharacterized SAM-binding protein YcdF (DUF218 family)
MIDMQAVASAANTIGYFLARRDIMDLTSYAMQAALGKKQADVLIVFGGMIPHGYDIAARVWQKGLAKHLLLVGGIGHTTECVRGAISERIPEIETDGRHEAEMMADYFEKAYGITDAIMETQSTNCGNNVTYALDVLKTHSIKHRSVIIMQDSTMQLRMAATFAKAAPEIRVINYAPYRPAVIVSEYRLSYLMDYWGMWSMEHYLSLLLGEISRLHDDKNGYGPQGMDYLAHVNIPPNVLSAAELLRQSGLGKIRAANPLYGSHKFPEISIA